MVNITDVKQILQFAIDAEIKVFLDGGWGVDALLGYQSRAHNDIDIFVEKNDYQNFC
jgi:lincosamide nucleotidyltransferase A/C/D/E